ncbi:MAG: Zn-ribbon domain-containing OB-fold protein [Acidilobus sp.]
MSWNKHGRLQDIVVWPEREEVDKYVYTPGIHGLELANALIDGKVLGMRCRDGRVYVPPKTLCPDFQQGELVEVRGPWRVQHYTVIYEDLYGNRLEKPVVVALVKPDDADVGMIHVLNADPSSVKPGMSVRPVFKPKEQRKGNILDIIYFEPA